MAREYNYSVGDIIKNVSGAKNIEIIGILEDNEKWLDSGIADASLVNLNQSFIGFYGEKLEEVDFLYYYCKLKDKKDIELVKGVFDEALKNTKSEFQITGIDDEMKKAFESKYNENKWWLVIAMIMLIFNILSVVHIMLAMVYQRRREIGIRMAIGYSVRQIMTMLMKELMLVVFGACATAIFIVKCLMQNEFRIFRFKILKLIHHFMQR